MEPELSELGRALRRAQDERPLVRLDLVRGRAQLLAAVPLGLVAGGLALMTLAGAQSS